MPKSKRATEASLSPNAREALEQDVSHLPPDHWFWQITRLELAQLVKKGGDGICTRIADAGLPPLRYCAWCDTVYLLEEISYSVSTLFSTRTEYVCRDCSKDSH